MSDVKSARRVLDILRFFSEEKEPASLARVAAALDLPKSSCLALLETLVVEGYAYQAEGRYYLTGRWAREAEIVTRHDRLAPRCRQFLQHLSSQLDETVMLAQLSQRKVVYLDVLEASHVLRFSAFVGQRKPVYASASGRALLATLSDDEVLQFARSIELAPLTPTTLSTPEALVAVVQEGRKRGWHLNLGEHQLETVSIAAPFLLDGTALAFVAGAPASRAKDRINSLGEALKRAAEEAGDHQQRKEK
ncbi:IclR family transcriptional regulator [Ottowia thiooxydans]|uniref:IclR family acetate operon transcriptional repressor n=1 Tax=Ottowia thiooxydans TaxID=219182 RepID=A0ABV2Q5D8_9BURK